MSDAPLIERPGHQGQRSYPDSPGGYGNGYPVDGDPRKGGRPRKTPDGNRDTQRRDLDRLKPAIMEEARQRLIARSSLTLDEPTVNSIVALVRDGNYPIVAAKSLGVGEAAFRSWMERGEEMARLCEPTDTDPSALQATLYLEVDEAEASFETSVVATMRERIESNKYWAGHMTLLERRFPHRWGRRDVSAHAEEGYEARLKAYMQGRDDERANARA